MKQDLLAKRYYSDNRRFADLINGIVCNGIQVVKQEDLSEMDTETSQGKRRDLVRKAVFGVNFAVLDWKTRKSLITDFRFVFWDMKPESMNIRQRKFTERFGEMGGIPIQS